MILITNIHHVSATEWTMLKRISRSNIKGEDHDQTECYNGGRCSVDTHLLLSSLLQAVQELPRVRDGDRDECDEQQCANFYAIY